MKRSRRVVLTMMGSGAIGAVSMGFVERRDLHRQRHDLERESWFSAGEVVSPRFRNHECSGSD